MVGIRAKRESIMHDLVIRAGTLVDGSGQPAYTGDLAISGGLVEQVGGKAGAGRREIDAQGCLVTPGWVDIHTHYDGQATWDPYLSPSTWHGVTTAIMGNCGVGFAPVKQDRRDWLIKVMEGVEDIPGTVLSEGMQWEWETFPEYLDALARRPRALDIGAQIPHSALRAYVMGDRAIHHDEASPQDLLDMRQLVREALDAGAMGFSTSKTFLHKYDERKYPPGTFATEDELMSLGTVLGEAGHGVFQMTANHPAMEQEMPWLATMVCRFCSICSKPMAHLMYGSNCWAGLMLLVNRSCRCLGASAAGRWVSCFRGRAACILSLPIQPFAG
jgi:N-acyl-D-aspartate/D-glutamate deacylase